MAETVEQEYCNVTLIPITQNKGHAGESELRSAWCWFYSVLSCEWCKIRPGSHQFSHCAVYQNIYAEAEGVVVVVVRQAVVRWCRGQHLDLIYCQHTSCSI